MLQLCCTSVSGKGPPDSLEMLILLLSGCHFMHNTNYNHWGCWKSENWQGGDQKQTYNLECPNDCRVAVLHTLLCCTFACKYMYMVLYYIDCPQCHNNFLHYSYIYRSLHLVGTALYYWIFVQCRDNYYTGNYSIITYIIRSMIILATGKRRNTCSVR